MNETIIRATFQPRDLIPAFLRTLEDTCPDTHLTLVRRWEDVIQSAEAQGWDSLCDDSLVREDLQIDLLLEDLVNALNDVAPDGHYFGPIEGDDSDFGFWPAEEVE